MKRQIVALVFIFICCTVAWEVLSIVMGVRTSTKSFVMSDAVGDMWGGVHSQAAPSVTVSWREVMREFMNDKEKVEYAQKKQHEEDLAAEREKRPARKVFVHEEEFVKVSERDFKQNVDLDSSDILVGLALEYRRKGLLWFSTYRVGFAAEYIVRNPVDRDVSMVFNFPYSHGRAVYDDMEIKADGREDFTVSAGEGAMTGMLRLPAKGVLKIRVAYKSRGMDEWSYGLGDAARIVKNFSLKMNTDFDAIDFPRDSISPDSKMKSGNGWELAWKKTSLVSALKVGMLMPHRINPGPLASSMSGGAPVSLLFYFFVIFMFQSMKNLRMHPMHYFFLAASFFAFNLLFSYLVDHVEITAAFIVSSMVSLSLVVPYVARVAGARFALVEAGLCQIIYQLAFSLAYFFEGYTGLTITIGAILTLGIVMHLTAGVDWSARFKGQDRSGIMPAVTSKGI